MVKPLIGITSSMKVDNKDLYLRANNIDAITQVGGTPIILPNIMEEDNIKELANKIDGLLVTGGEDIDPTMYGEEPHKNLEDVTPIRDFFELELTKLILEKGKPYLGICRGSQVLNIAAGGTLFQDIYAQSDSELIQHLQKAPKGHGSHFATITQGSLLHRLTGQSKLKVNSYHHQACRKIAEGFQVCGLASDGIVEAIESKEHPFVLGVQWHPEHMVDNEDKTSYKIFQGFIEACKA